MQLTSLNHVYRVIWSQVLRAWVVVAENVKGRGKSTSCKFALSIVTLAAGVAQAAPVGGQIISGSGNISRSGAVTTINQSSQNLSTNWKGFNIAANETVNFVQPSASAIAVNRIFDTNGTQILGHLNANGQVFLINPNGILFGHGAQVNVGGLVASTLDLSDAALNSAAKAFSGNGAGSVINQGAINGGYVALLGNRVSNEGVIVARQGAVTLGAGSAATLTFNGSNLVHMQIDQSVLDNMAENGGLIRADGGMVIMAAGARDALLASVVNNAGVIEAYTVDSHGGNIVLQGGAAAGATHVSGTLDASNNRGKGGTVTVLGNHVQLASDAVIDVNGATGGGVVHVGGGARGEDPNLANAANTNVAAGALIHADATLRGDGGNIVLWGDMLHTAGTLTARGGAQGGNGGLVETSGHVIDIAGSNVQTASPLGAAGTWLLDPLDVDIVAGATSGVTSNPNPAGGTTSPTTTTSTLAASDIVAALNAGNSVTVQTTGTVGAQQGNITISVPVTMTANPVAAPTLTLNAAGSIMQNAAISSTGGKLNVTMTSVNAPGLGSGAGTGGHWAGRNCGLCLYAGINANGGNISLSNQFGAGSVRSIGILVTNNATIQTNGAGTISIQNTGTVASQGNLATGVEFDDGTSILSGGNLTVNGLGHIGIDTGGSSLNGITTVTSSNGSVIFNGSTASGSTTGVSVNLVNQTNITAANDVTINGAVPATGSATVELEISGGSSITATNGTVTLSTDNNSSVFGIEISDANITGKSVALSGTGTDLGINLIPASITATNGTLSITGNATSTSSSSPLRGVYLNSSSLSSTGGTTITGNSADTNGIGVEISQALALGGAGATTVTDTAASMAPTSIRVDADAAITNTGTGSVTLTGVRNNVIVNGSIDNGANGLTIGAGTSYAAGNANLANGNVTFTGQITDTGNVHIYSGGITQTTFNGSINGSSPFIAGSGSFRYNAAYGDTPNAAATVGNGLDYVLYREQPTVTVTSANTSKLYGTADPMLPPPVESGQRNGDTVAQIGGAITRAGFGTFAGENVGVYDYAIGASQLGYALTLAGPPQLTITPAQLTVTPTSGQSKVYGQTDPALGYGSTGLVSATIDGVTLNDTEAGVLSGALDRAAGSNVGSYTIGAGTLGLTGTGAGTGSNYMVTVTSGANFAITPAALTLAAVSNGKTYDGTTAAAALPTVSGLVGSDTVSGLAETYDNPNSGSGKTITVSSGYTVNDSNGGNNYIVSAVASANGVIMPKPLSVTGETANNKVYDGTTTATFSGGNLNGVIVGDAVALQTDGNFATKNAGTGIVVTANNSLSGASALNYTLMQPTGLAADILPATLTYNATPAIVSIGQTPSGLSGTVTGFVPGDTQSNATTGSVIWSADVVATSPPGKYGITGSGLTAANYIFIQAAANANGLTLNESSSLANSPSSLSLASSTGLQPWFEPSTGRVTVGMPTADANALTPMGTFATNADGQDDAFLYDAEDRLAMNSGANQLHLSGPKLHIVDGGVALSGNLVETAASPLK